MCKQTTLIRCQPRRFATTVGAEKQLLFLSLCLFVVSAHICSSETLAQTPNKLGFQDGPKQTFLFDTGKLRGKLRTDKLAFGVFDLQRMSQDIPLAGRHGLMNVYRVFSDGKRYGDAGWTWASEARRMDDGSVVIECAADDARPFVFRGIYRWRNPTTLDFEIQVVPLRELHAFEVFLASYFDPRFTSCRVNVDSLPGTPGTSGFLAAKQSLGHWMMFPRDEQAVKVIQDGRWKLPPHPVDWKIMPKLQRPLALRRDVTGKTTVALMARRQDCFAIAMPYETEGHFSVYLSLFGRDLPAGKPAIARARLQVLDTPTDAEAIECFRTFEKETAAREQ